MKKLFAALFVIQIVTAISAPAKEWTVIRFGVDPSYAPFESKNATGELVGFDIDVGNAICEKLHVKSVWVENDFDGMIPALKARKIDAVLSSLLMTEKRLQQIDFSDKVFYTPTRMVAKTGSGLLPTADSLKGR